MPPTRVLYLLRHAKSNWDAPELEDHERPLAPRGRRAAGALAEHIRSAGIEPELVLCSSARRARETLEGVDPSGERMIEDELYGAAAGPLLERLQQLPDSLHTAMVIGHNPTLQVLALRLTFPGNGAGDGSDLAELQQKFPTGALVTLKFEGSWSDLGPGRTRLAGFVRPRELERR